MSESTEQGSGPVEDVSATEPVAETPETPAAEEISTSEPAPEAAGAAETTAEPGPATTAADEAGTADEPAATASDEPTTQPDPGATATEEPAAAPEPEPKPEATTSDEPAAAPAPAAAPEATASDEPAQQEAEPTEQAESGSQRGESTTESAERTASTEPETAAEPPEPESATTEPENAGTKETPEGDTAETPAEPAPKPDVPKPSAIPSPAALARPRPPKPGAPGQAAPAARPAGAAAQSAPAAPAPVVPVIDDAAATAEAEKHGRVAEDGTVYVVEKSGERAVGQFPGVGTSEALSLYVRRYLDLVAKVSLFETRLDSADLSVKEIDQTLAKLAEETAEPAAVGDLEGLRARVEGLKGRAAERRAALETERAAAKAEAVKAREAIVEAAEKIAGTDPAKMQWRPAGEELRALLDRWKAAQRGGPRIDRGTEESLWKRFSHARTAFDRERRHFFADLEQRNKEAKAAKELLVSEAEALSDSTDWGYTAGAYRDLMARWKAAGRASRKDDDALWARFRAAQDRFFQARDAANAAIDAEYGENLKVKEELLVEAEKLVPIKDLTSAKRALRGIQDRWDEAGKVPRRDIQRVENRMRAVENAVRDAEQDQWRRSNPETKARAEGAAAQLESAIADLESDLEAARAKGDARKISELESSLAARRSWLEQVVRAAEDSTA
ncbi:DUF349 domain-containing protein [Myceligenerans xiligouense]|uniref:Uncharacterized protein DUF349 n=1 Tax=Myceligenerans xiligouense TaxID=253184 RepID=A0A3N4YK43_9MICO|nr:DUF349 domain-containing protein [Myceligenerans xiligouense]RPF21113.1 uncharacterized protein DUF349 [Myceligenerans xiligouense]